MVASGFSWWHLIPSIGHDQALAGLGIDAHTYLVPTAYLVCLVLIGLALVARASLNKAMARPGLEKYFADDKLTPRTIVEVYATGIHGLVRDMLGDKDAAIFFPYLASLFIYIFVSNLSGILPGFLPPTDNINNNVGMAVLSFLIFNYVGLSRDPVGYVKHLLGPVWWLAWFLVFIELFGLMLRPVTLSLRLTANMFGDHMVFNIMSGLVPIGVPAIFLAFAIFVSFIQAFVFTLLTTIYINLSKPHDDHGDEHGHGDGHDHDHAHGHGHAPAAAAHH